MNQYVNVLTGEVIESNTKLGAYFYFNKAAHVCGYEVNYKDIKRIVKKTGKIYGEK